MNNSTDPQPPIPRVIKIVAIGPESTGKSTLCERLASHFSTVWCKEYARAYLLEHGRDYTYDDLLTIAKGQLQAEDDAVLQLTAKLVLPETGKRPFPATLLIIDTDMIVMKVWSEFVFGRCHSFILDEIVKREYHGYLLCKPDLDWVKDELREYPDLETRDQLYHHYKDAMVNQSTPWHEVSGQDPDRTESAIAWVEGLVNTLYHDSR
jgi:NadR type nicotinamide-nucleotide adenylyltransferase